VIRPGTKNDIPRIIEMGKRLHDDSTYKHIEYSPERVEVTCKTMIEAGFFVVAEKDGLVIGAMMGDVYTPWYSTDKLGIDYTFYVEPEHRNGLIAVKMLKMFESWCISMGAKQIRPGVGTGDPSVIRLYEAMGYIDVGNWFLKNI
jgi:GNAT superfamily N-acetyltransferase